LAPILVNANVFNVGYKHSNFQGVLQVARKREIQVLVCEMCGDNHQTCTLVARTVEGAAKGRVEVKRVFAAITYADKKHPRHNRMPNNQE